MQTIWKYPFRVADEVILNMPKKSKCLSVDVQNGVPCIWAMVDTESFEDEKRITVIGTGLSSARDIFHMRFLGTFMLPDGAFVGHVFVDD